MISNKSIYTVDQYNSWADEHDWKTLKYDKESRALFYTFLNFETKGKKTKNVGIGRTTYLGILYNLKKLYKELSLVIIYNGEKEKGIFHFFSFQ